MGCSDSHEFEHVNINNKYYHPTSRQELLVYGYFGSFYKNFPTELCNLCLKYYLSYDQWDSKRTDCMFRIRDENYTTLRPPNLPFFKFMNAFGFMVIGKGEKFEWNLKCQAKVTAMVGIIDIGNISNNMDKCFTKYYGFAIYVYNGCLYGNDISNKPFYGKPFSKITMTLDMTQENYKKYGVLSFALDGIDKGVAFNNIDINGKYCMAVSVYDDPSPIYIVG